MNPEYIFSNLNHTIPNIISMPILSYYYKLNQKCLYSADLHLVEFLKIWDFFGIWNMIQIFPNLFDTGNQSCTMKFIEGKINSFLTSIRRLCFWCICLSVCVCNYSNSNWRLRFNAMHPHSFCSHKHFTPISYWC